MDTYAALSFVLVIQVRHKNIETGAVTLFTHTVQKSFAFALKAAPFAVPTQLHAMLPLCKAMVQTVFSKNATGAPPFLLSPLLTTQNGFL